MRAAWIAIFLAVLVWSDAAADAFPGTQGDVWDTRSDMGWALFGAMIGLLLLRRLHDRQLSERGFVDAVRY